MDKKDFSKLQDFCRTLEAQWGYIAKDGDGTVKLYEGKPDRVDMFEMWSGHWWAPIDDVAGNVDRSIFDCLSFSDERPYNIKTGQLDN